MINLVTLSSPWAGLPFFCMQNNPLSTGSSPALEMSPYSMGVRMLHLTKVAAISPIEALGSGEGQSLGAASILQDCSANTELPHLPSRQLPVSLQQHHLVVQVKVHLSPAAVHVKSPPPVFLHTLHLHQLLEIHWPKLFEGSWQK